MNPRTPDAPLILLVDDEPDILSYLKDIITRLYPGVGVILAPNASAGLDVLRSRDIDLIVSDHHMPGTDGVTMLTTARSIAPRALRVLLTGHADLQTAQRAVNEGQIHAFFQKPVEAGVLIRSLRWLLESRTTSRVEPRSIELTLDHAGGPDPRPALVAGVPRILVVDDVIEVAELFRSFAGRLPAGSVHIDVERDPREALRRLERDSFVGIISDYNMPHVKGTQLLQAARKAQPSARRVLITGYNETPDTYDSLSEAAIDAYLEKPISMSDVHQLLVAIISPDAHAMDTYRAQARIAERAAKREPTTARQR